ncbi:PulJ/GspJ family protein [Vibrio mangrovi]|uniref:Prepilin-type N-terminal cleavage/methylation domain-containing protein n=1 Tax=Vibrio mangrovi TaxID=474394 RepID=A0A1Y6IS70_9VIBR|nr:prepilin-type N-terminal cleavage/methylation domain-containing protein [Vibrio mangrovi]MDW6003329.1 prepilin-type N-terminal cleavage/methylation domain-containing protein [Vibrio mangrovi]SMR99881.1 hypothetical protein VIM7927_01116 [Vibrio mangrovi]
MIHYSYIGQRGLTLLEVLLASVLSSVLILTLSRLIVSEVKVAERLSRKIQLHQQLRASLALMKRSLLTAGFDASSQEAVLLNDSQRLTDVQPEKNQVGYVYQMNKEHQSDFHHVVYQQADSISGVPVLRLCEKQTGKRLTFKQAAFSGESGPCFSVFDPEWVSVDSFQVSYQSLRPLPAKERSSGWISVHLALSLVQEPSIQESADFSFLQRHWRP